MNIVGTKKRVVVAMSGGVDSSVAAALIAREGYEVVGITLQLYDHGVAVQKKGACCAGQDIIDARRVAEKIGIHHYVLNYEDRFKQSVMDDFADSYLNGETPIPCVRCNQRVKFKDLLETARDLGAEYIATGHYAQRVEREDGVVMTKAVDEERDQSYFLFATTREQLDFLRFPLGGMRKSEIRRIAADLELPVADKPDSQDICFVPNGKYADVVERLRPGSLESGDIMHIDGRVLGRHNGIINYTIGQRRGIGVADKDPLYVIKLDASKNLVYVGPHEALAKNHVNIADFNWMLPGSRPDKIDVMVKYRSTTSPIPAVLCSEGNAQIRVEFKEPQFGVSPGQALVAYDGDVVMGGGWIVRS